MFPVGDCNESIALERPCFCKCHAGSDTTRTAKWHSVIIDFFALFALFAVPVIVYAARVVYHMHRPAPGIVDAHQ